ncbi:MAG: hypothetical protein LC792_20375 [Actinobacteria bacterium]|nr:hypothetical protein [Actinomycetota bacterium]
MGAILTWPAEGDESPFRHRLVENDAIRSPKGRLRVLEGDGRFVVRLVPSLQLAGVPGLLAITRRLHGELESVGLALPPRLYLMGSRHRDGTPQGFVVARAVVGCEMPGGGRELSAFAAEADALGVTLAGYYEARFETGGRVVPDIRLDQFVFGRVDDRGPQLWFVDLDPGFVEIRARTTDAVELARVHWRIAETAAIVAGLEAAAGRRLPAARAAIARLLASDMFRHASAEERPAVLRRILDEGELFDGGQWVQEQIAACDNPTAV